MVARTVVLLPFHTISTVPVQDVTSVIFFCLGGNSVILTLIKKICHFIFLSHDTYLLAQLKACFGVRPNA
jgi:hypothetical protein